MYHDLSFCFFIKRVHDIMGYRILLLVGFLGERPLAKVIQFYLGEILPN